MRGFEVRGGCGAGCNGAELRGDAGVELAAAAALRLAHAEFLCKRLACWYWACILFGGLRRGARRHALAAAQ